MPIYRVNLAGRTKPILLKADNATDAKDKLVSLKALTADEKDEALENGEKLWRPGEAMPADEAPPPKAEPEVQQQQEEQREDGKTDLPPGGGDQAPPKARGAKS